MSNFRTRVSTAIIFGIVMLTGLFLNKISFFILFFIIGMGCLWEFLGLMLEEGKLRKYVALALGAILYVIMRFSAVTGSWNLNMAIGWTPNIMVVTSVPLFKVILIIPFILLILELFLQSEKPFQNVGIILLGLFYTILIYFPIFNLTAPFLMGLLDVDVADRFESFTPHIVAGILFLNWANDSGAYLVGSRIGKTPLLPRISPKKTWEGTIGGAVFCLGIGYVLSLFFKELGAIDWMILGLIVGIFGTLGDLVESMLKRSVGVKDSGSFMPGHGGFLDRFDAFIFSIPFAYLYLTLFK